MTTSFRVSLNFDPFCIELTLCPSIRPLTAACLDLPNANKNTLIHIASHHPSINLTIAFCDGLDQLASDSAYNTLITWLYWQRRQIQCDSNDGVSIAIYTSLPYD
eukprot:177827_1